MDCLLSCGSEVDIEIFIVDNLSSPPPEELNCSLPKLFPIRKSYCGSEVNIEENFSSSPPSLDKSESK